MLSRRFHGCTWTRFCRMWLPNYGPWLLPRPIHTRWRSKLWRLPMSYLRIWMLSRWQIHCPRTWTGDERLLEHVFPWTFPLGTRDFLLLGRMYLQRHGIWLLWRSPHTRWWSKCRRLWMCGLQIWLLSRWGTKCRRWKLWGLQFHFAHSNSWRVWHAQRPRNRPQLYRSMVLRYGIRRLFQVWTPRTYYPFQFSQHVFENGLPMEIGFGTVGAQEAMGTISRPRSCVMRFVWSLRAKRPVHCQGYLDLVKGIIPDLATMQIPRPVSNLSMAVVSVTRTSTKLRKNVRPRVLRMESWPNFSLISASNQLRRDPVQAILPGMRERKINTVDVQGSP